MPINDKHLERWIEAVHRVEPEIAAWENEGGARPRKLHDGGFLSMDFSWMEQRILAHHMSSPTPPWSYDPDTGRTVSPTGRWRRDVPDMIFYGPDGKPNSYANFKPAYIKPSDRVNITINAGDFDPKNWPPHLRERMEANQREIARIIDQRFRAAAGIRDYSAGDVELGTKLHKLFEVERKPYPWWKRVRGWLVWHLWQRWVL